MRELKWTIGLVVAATLGCATQTKKPDLRDSLKEEASESQAFSRGMQALEAENYSAAAEIFDRLLVQQPATELDLVTLYNAGAAREGLGECKQALDRYRRVVKSSAGKFNRIEAEALYRASLMYECLEQDTKAIPAMIDARKRSKELSVEIRAAELPARLAAAYARIGNRARALHYFNEAGRGLKRVVSLDGQSQQIERVSRTLFFMGRLSPTQRKAEVEPIAFLKSLAVQQPYLLQSIELNHSQWSNKSTEDLRTAYDNLWRFKFDDQRQNREFLTRALQTLNELRKIRLPMPNTRVDSVFALLDKTETRIQSELMQMADGIPLTPEAKKRQGLRREGRLVDPVPAPKRKK